MDGLPEQFKLRMQKRLGKEYPAFLASYENLPRRGLRVNTLKLSGETFAELSPFPLMGGVEWEKDGFVIGEEKVGSDVYHHAGLFYLQEPSAMCAAPLLGVKAGERVLDLCAAPGGKTAQLAAAMGGKGVLIANEIDFGRAKILSQNVERMGIGNCAVTCSEPTALARRFGGYFDKVLADAPCSGEGMFKKEPNAITEWSEDNVRRCAVRQSAILDAAAEMVAVGGRLVYSTCTFAEEEDEWQIRDFLGRHADFVLLHEEKLYPHKVCGEGHFCALLERREGRSRPLGDEPPVRPFALRRSEGAERAFAAFASDFFGDGWGKGDLHTLADGRMYLVPEGMPDLAGMRLLRLGVELGTWDGKLFKPAHALAMALGGGARRKILLTREEARAYLKGETLPCDCENGWCAVLADGFPVGLGKAVNGTLKNHYPKGLRLHA